MCFYFLGIFNHKKFKTVTDVYKLVQSLGDEYISDANIFKQRNIDGFWFLNQIDDKKLIRYGIEDKDHRLAILDAIENLREECPENIPVV